MQILIKILGLKNYLRILQQSFFLFYRTGLLKYNSKMSYYHFVRYLIDKGEVILDIGANSGYYSFLFSRWTGNTGKVFSFVPAGIYSEIFNEKAKKYKNIIHYPVEKFSLHIRNLDRIDYIRYDLKGYEFSVFPDLKIIIEKFKPKVQMSISKDNENQVLEFFYELGYTPYKLHKYRLFPLYDIEEPLPDDIFFIPDDGELFE